MIAIVLKAGLYTEYNGEEKANFINIAKMFPNWTLRFDELFPDRHNFSPFRRRAGAALLSQIYLACHKRHIRASSTPYRLSARDSSILVHLNDTVPVTSTELAAHLSVRGSTLSAGIQRLERFGYLQRKKMPRDRRTVALTLTQQGAKAMAETSVLDSERVAAVLLTLNRDERKQALEGLLFAKASR